MSQEAAFQDTLQLPGHVSPDQVRAFDFSADPEMARCPFAAIARLSGESGAFWNPTLQRLGGGGMWVLTSAEDTRFVLNRPDLFSSKGGAGFSALVGESWDLIPLELDPPAHTQFRQLLNPLLSPGAVGRMTPGVTSRAIELIEAVRGEGGCEFMAAFGRPFPVSIFMQLMGLPAEKTETFLDWEFDLLHAREIPTKIAAATAIRDYLLQLAAERRAAPVDDLTSFVVNAELDGRRLTDDEVMGILYLLFVGGLDTVASSLGFFFRHLAENPEQQRLLRANPAMIPRAVEELLRRFSVVTVHRRCNTDVDVGVAVVCALGSLDPAAFDKPLDVVLDRKDNRHFGFSYGPHFCLGSHLARRELVVALGEWLARVPTWRLKSGAPLEVHGGGVFGVEHLELEWDAA